MLIPHSQILHQLKDNKIIIDNTKIIIFQSIIVLTHAVSYINNDLLDVLIVWMLRTGLICLLAANNGVKLVTSNTKM